MITDDNIKQVTMSSPKTRRRGSSIFMTLETDPSSKLTIPSVQSDASFLDSLQRQRVNYIRRSSGGDDGVNGSMNHVKGLIPHEQLRRHSANLPSERRRRNLLRRHSDNLPRFPQSSLIKAVSAPDLASKSMFAVGRRVIMRRRTLDYSWKPEWGSTFLIDSTVDSTVATDTDNFSGHTTGENGHKALDPTALRYLPKILRDTYAQRQTKRPSIVSLTFF